MEQLFQKNIPINIEDEMKKSYMDYAMSVIIGRAIPDVRDGMKPVHRRVLFAMSEMGNVWNKPYKKSARIVGDIIGKYHPHGDTAAYDTIVRMAQDFSMRYPLIDGQGNFGCFTGETKIKILDGTERSFEELSRLGPDEVFYVYSVNRDGRIVIGKGRNARVTRRDTQLVELTMDSGDTIRCTPDHRFMLRDGSYKEAAKLTKEDSLMPGYFDTAPVKEGLNDYLRVLQPSTGKYDFVHHLADEFNALSGAAPKIRGPYVRHHRNFNRRDNRPDNIRRMAFLEHLRVHADQVDSLWEDEDFRKRQREGVKKYYQDNPAVREERRRRIIEQNKSEAFRNSQSVRLSSVLKKLYLDRPDKKAAISLRMKALWEKPWYRHKMSCALQGIQKRELSPKERARVAEILSQKSRAMWGDEGKRKEIVDAINLAMASPIVSAKISRAVRQAWQDPAYRAKFPKEHFAKMARACWEKPETRRIHREKRLRQQNDPVFRTAHRLGVQCSNARRMMENPKMMVEMAEKSAQSLTARWTDPEYKRQVIRSKVARYVSSLRAGIPDGIITPQAYEENRHDNWIPRLETSLSYFDSFDEMLQHSVNYNHRVVGIRWLEERADTYDIEVDEHHNFLLASGVFVHNSIDADPPAAMRYTEIRMARLAEEMLADIEKETVDFVPNYDASLEEPTVLPARIPALLLNGTSGIAVGVATNIPPHNLGEIIDGTIALIRDPEITIQKLMQHIKGPDFPTAAFINGRDGIISAYNTGRGSIRMRARAIIERNARNDRESIIVTELPYLVNKAGLIEKISDLVKEKKMEGISDLRDESDRDGIRIVIDLKKDEPSGVILNQLYKHTQMETTFGVIMLAIDRNQPRVLNLKEVLQRFVDFRKEVITRRTIFDLRKAKERAHILEGLIIALNNIDAVVQLIKKSKSPQEAGQALMEKFGLSEIQARAILDMRLQRLTGLERAKIDDEYAELTRLIAELQGVLDDPKKVLAIIVAELEEIKKKYGDERRTEIVESVEDIDIEDMIVEEDMVVTVSHYGYIKRNPVSLYRSQRRGGKGKVGMGTKEEDFVEKIFIASTHHYILIFTSVGRIYWLKVYQIPQAGRASKGKAIVNLVNLSPGERVAAVLPVREFVEGKYVIMVTRKGITKKTDLAAYSNPRSGGIIAISIDQGDELIAVQLTHGDQDVFLGTRKGQSIRFHEDDVRDMGRTARGVIGIRMDDDDAVVGMEIPSEGNSIITVSENGYGKRTDVEEYRRQSRGGQGVINLKTVSKVGDVSGVLQVTGDEDIMLISNTGKIIRLKVAEVPLLHRSTQGVRLIEIDPDEKLVGVARAEREAEEKDNGLPQQDVEEEEVSALAFEAGDEEDK